MDKKSDDMHLVDRYISLVNEDLYPLVKLALPLIMIGMVQSSVFFFQTLFFAHLGKQILASGALVNWLLGTLVVIMFGTLSSINILISHKHGSNNQVAIPLILRDGLLLAILFSLAAFLLFWNMPPIFLLFGQHSTVVLLAKPYLHALAWGLLPDFIIIAILEFFIGLGHTRILMLFNALSVCLNLLFSYTLIFGKFGLPALSIAGAGWGTTISYWITLMVLITYVLWNKNYKAYFHHAFNSNKSSFLSELLRVGVPIGMMYCIEVGFFFSLTLIMGSINIQLLAANQITMQYMGTIMTVVFSVANAITVRMGHLLGANKISSARQAGYAGIYLSTIFMGLVAISYWFFPRVLISADLDVNNPNNLDIIHDITKLLRIAALFQILEAIRISLFGALRALKDTYFTLLSSIISFWVIALPLGYLLARYFQFGGVALWWGMLIGSSFSIVLLLYRFQSKINYNDNNSTIS